MPTMVILPPDDYFGMLNRELAGGEIHRRMGASRDLLREVLQFGLGLWERVVQSVEESWLHDATVRLLWQLLEALDGVDILVRAGAIYPGRVQARNLIEISFQLLYILERDEERVAAAYTTHFRRRRLKSARELVKGSAERAALEQEVARTRHVPSDWLDKFGDTIDEVNRIESSLAEPMWAETNAELENLPDRAPWYQAFGGPPNVRELAKRVRMELWYRYVYSPLSEAVHGAGPQRVFRIGEVGLRPRPLRDAEDWEEVIEPSYILTLEVFQAVIARYRVGEEKNFFQWYRDAIRPRLPARLGLPEIDDQQNGGYDARSKGETPSAPT